MECCIWGDDLVDMQLLSKYEKKKKKKEFVFHCVSDIHNKHAWLILSKNKKGETITKAFQKLLKIQIIKQTKCG